MPVGNKLKGARYKKDGAQKDEMQALLARLKQIVPNMPRNRKLSKLEIIQHVIDYIVDLQVALEGRPVLPQGSPQLPGSCRRRPLGVLSASASQQISHLMPPARHDETSG